MVIDSHSHLKHGDAAATEYTAEEIVRVMDAVGIDRSVVFAMSTTTRRSLEFAERAVAQFPDRLLPYAYALPSYERPVVPELEEALGKRGFKGIKIHMGECSLAPYIIDPVLELAGKHGVPCLIDLLGRHSVAESLAKRFPQTRLLIAHLGQYLCTNTQLLDRFIALAETYPNVSLDVSGVVMISKIAEAVTRIGASRVIWGIDGPHQAPDVITFAKLELEKVRLLHLDPKDEHMVLGGSIAKLLGM